MAGEAAAGAPVPDRLGEFAIDRVLGQGGSGVVYAARRNGRSMALKVLRPDEVPTGKERRRFLAEAANMARIDHPGVVRVLDSGELDDGRPFLAMELLDGVSLAARLAQGPLSVERALGLFEQLADAVVVLHEAGLIHRDLKPENVMLVDRGQRVVLLDFGIARAADAPPSTTTEAGMQRGTPAYMAPERFFGARATLSSDIYELGLILYVMIMGELPWREAINAKERLEPKRPLPGGRELPGALEAAIMSALSSDTDDRPTSARDLADQVRRAGAAVPMWMAASGAGLVAATSGKAHIKTEAAPSAAITAPGRPRRTGWIAGGVTVAALAGIGLWVGLAIGDGETADTNTAAAPVADAGVVAMKMIGAASDDSQLDAATPVAVTAPPDATAAVVRPVGAAKRTRVSRRPARTPARKPKATPPPQPKPATPAATGSLPSCMKVLGVLCSKAFKDTEGSFRGAQCRNMTKQVRNWQGFGPKARAGQQTWCKNYLPVIRKVLKARQSYIKKHGGPPTGPPP